MKGKVIGLLVVAMFLVALVPTALAATPISVGGSIGGGIIIATQNFAPRVYLDPDTRILLHNNADGNVELVERRGNYAFEGEQIQWDVLVWDVNGVETIDSVHGIAGLDEVAWMNEQSPLDYREVLCVENGRTDDPYAETMAQDEAGSQLSPFNSQTMRWYTCTFTVERAFDPSAIVYNGELERDPAGNTNNVEMHGPAFIAVEAIDSSGLSGVFVEDEYFFLNPYIAIDVWTSNPNGLVFTDGFNNPVRPGVTGYSNAVVVENAVEPDSGVELVISISGTDFYDPLTAKEGGQHVARCPDSNVLELINFRYFASQANYDTTTNAGTDAEGYDTIPYETGDISDRELVIDPIGVFPGSVLAEGQELVSHFKVDLPQPCVGEFTLGDFYFWGRAI